MLFVSCQPYRNEMYYTQTFILNMAYAAKMGGAKGLRIEGFDNINFIKKNIDLPIIGLIKENIEANQRYISPPSGGNYFLFQQGVFAQSLGHSPMRSYSSERPSDPIKNAPKFSSHSVYSLLVAPL